MTTWTTPTHHPYAGGTLLHGGVSTGRVVKPANPTGGGMALGGAVVPAAISAGSHVLRLTASVQAIAGHQPTR